MEDAARTEPEAGTVNNLSGMGRRNGFAVGKPVKSPRLRSLALSACLFTFACIVTYLPTQAQAVAQGCNGIGQVSPLYVYANIRGQAGNTTATPIATVQKGTSVPVSGTQVVRGNEVWFALCGGGYASGGVVSYSAFTPTVTPTRTPTVAVRTPTQATPTRIVASPTLLPGQMTATPEATGNPAAVWQYGVDGKLSINVFCPSACEFVIEVENLK